MTDGWDGILQDGETILWQGQPVKGVLWQDLASPMTLMGVVFTAFSSLWIAAASGMIREAGAPGFLMVFPLFGLPFLAMGLYMLGGHLVLDAARRNETWYTLTSRAAFVATAHFGRKVLDTHALADMPFIRLEAGDPGSVLFGDSAPMATMRRGRHGRARRGYGAVPQPVGFRRIAEADTVYRLMRRARFDLTGDDLT